MTTNQLSPNPASKITSAERLQAGGQLANQLAANAAFADYLSRRAHNTIRAQLVDLERFAKYLHATFAAAYTGAELQNDPLVWKGITWGTIEGFVKWQLMAQQGYAVATVNRALSTIKTYVKLATKAGVIGAEEYQLIRTVSGYGQKEAKRVNERREVTRTGWKKSVHTSISPPQAVQLKTHPNTSQGRRDAFLMCLLLEHGLRVSEVSILTVENFDAVRGEMTFYRPKVDLTQTHKLTHDTQLAFQYYHPHLPASGRILRGSRKGGKLTDQKMNESAILQRVSHFGKRIGLTPLSPHDCRHYCATEFARHRPEIRSLCDWFGWNSPAMALRYIESASVLERGF